jgi:ribonuclease VapC
VIVADTSAVIAILQGEPEQSAFVECISRSRQTFLSAVSFQEAAMVLAGRVRDARTWVKLDGLIQALRIKIVPHDLELARVAREAFLTFGKGRHPAALNCGDCAAYALAKSRSLPLLFKGQDFARTDLEPAIAVP